MTDSIWAMPFFAGKTVVITGGTTGIGNGIAMAFAGAGAIVHATGATAAEVTAARACGTPVSYSVLDVRDMTAVEGYSSQFTSVAALVNCAGVNLRAAEFTVQGFETVVDINLTGSMRSASAFRGALSNGGAIVNIASMFAFFGAAHAPAYAASKGAVVQLTKSLAIAYAGDGIRVNALARDRHDRRATGRSSSQRGIDETHSDGSLGYAGRPDWPRLVLVFAARGVHHWGNFAG